MTDLPDVGAVPGAPEAVDIFDTTLRDGAQFEGISLSVEDKLRVAEQLDWLGVHWIEGGYPQANPKDEEFFRRAPKELDLSRAQLVAFGSTRRPLGRSDDDPTLRALVDSGASTACIVGKSWDFHVTEALQTTLDEGVAMVSDSVRFLNGAGLRVFFDAEHFFDGYKANPEYALAGPRGRRDQRRRLPGVVRHQRWFVAPRGPADRGRGGLVLRRPADRHPHPERFRMRGRQLRGGRGRRGDPGPGNGQRVRRTNRERQPHDRDPGPDAQARDRHAARWSPRSAHARVAGRGRAREPAAPPRGSLRRVVRVRPQGRPSHLGVGTGRRRQLRARGSGGGREPHPSARLRPGRPCRNGDEGSRVRCRPRWPRRRRSCPRR